MATHCAKGWERPARGDRPGGSRTVCRSGFFDLPWGSESWHFATIPMEGPALPGHGSFSWPLPAAEASSLHQEGGAADGAGHREARRAAGRGPGAR